MALEGVEPVLPGGPVRPEPFVDLAQRLGPQPVQAALRVDAHVNQTRLTQHPKVLGDRWLTRAELRDQVADGALPFAQEVEDPPAIWLSENGEHIAEYSTVVICLSRYVLVLRRSVSAPVALRGRRMSCSWRYARLLSPHETAVPAMGPVGGGHAVAVRAHRCRAGV